MNARKSVGGKQAAAPISVLLSEGLCLSRESLRQVIEHQPGIRVVGEAGDVGTAFREVARSEPDVVLVSVPVATRPVIDATRELVQKFPESRVLALSARAAPGVVRAMLEAGARGYLTRASGAADLVKGIRAVASGKQFLGQDVAGDLAKGGSRDDQKSADQLTATEYEIVRLVAEGKSNHQAAAILDLSPRTVETYRLRLMRKLSVDSLPGLVKYAIREGITTLE